MRQFLSVLALTATVAVASEKCKSISCTSPFVSVPTSDSKYCDCLCAYSNGTACPAGQEAATDGSCGCVDSDPCAGSNCDDKAEPARWMMDADCMCAPAMDEDRCDAIYGGAFSAADGTDCPAGEVDMGESGAVAQTVTIALAIVAAMLF